MFISLKLPCRNIIPSFVMTPLFRYKFNYSKHNNNPITQEHLETLKSNLLEKNLKRLIEPYSRVEIAQISKLIELPEPDIEVRFIINLVYIIFLIQFNSGNYRK